MVSVNRLLNRRSDFKANKWIMDSGAFSNIFRNGVHLPITKYIDIINRFKHIGILEAVVTQDYMCETPILKKTGLTVKDHQRMTIQNYDELRSLSSVYVMPVLQGYRIREYINHLDQYEDRLSWNQWIGIGSVCKRNSTNPFQVFEILSSINKVRPDLRLHGFGLKKTCLLSPDIRNLLFSSDSMAWSFNARMKGRNANGLEECLEFHQEMNEIINRK